MGVGAGEADDEGYDDEYQLEDLEVTAADYIKAVAAPNFRSAWEELGEDTEIANEYGLGVRESLQV